MISFIYQLALKKPNDFFCLNPCCTYKELLINIEYVKSQLIKKNIKNKIVLVPAKNSLDHIVICIALIHLGCIYAPINISSSELQIEEIIKKYKIDAICNNEIVFTNSTLKAISFKLDLNFPKNIELKLDIEPICIDTNKFSHITFTSGSTGIPKAVAHSLNNHIISATYFNTVIPLDKNSLYLFSLPIFHVGGFAIIIRTIINGSTILFNNDLTLEDALNKYKTTHISLVPTQLYKLLDDGFAFEKTSIKYVLLGGAPISKKLIEDCLNNNIKPFISYGLSETASQICISQITSKQKDVEAKLLPGRVVKLTKQNEILIKGETLALGYYNGFEIIPITDKDGYFHTKDIGKIKTNDKGEILISIDGRLDNQFISGGENIQPEEIEKILLMNTCIKRCVILGVDDPKWGKKVVALLDTTLSETEFFSYAKKNLAKHQIPKQLFNLNNFSIKSFKINRKQLLKEFLNSTKL